ncbi:MAG: phosphoglycolate phosphatase [Paracoccaceae bacterium]
MAHIVFDLDGTLIDSAPDIHAAANAVLAEAGAAPISLADTRRFIGNGAPTFVARMRAARGLPEKAQAPLYAAFAERYAQAVELTKAYAGVCSALEALAGQGHRMGICTNKPLIPTRAVMDHLGLSAHFAAIYGGDSLPVHKPDPAPLRACFKELAGGEVAPQIYIGDSEVDAETAQRAGLRFLLFTEGYRKSEVAQIAHHAAFDDFAALPDLVAGLLAQIAAGA